MQSAAVASPWTILVDTLAAHGLSDQVSNSAADAGWRQDGAAHGYPLLASPSRLNYAFAFLPPLAARQVSAVLADEDMDFEDASAARSAGEYEWRHVMFAGWNFADGDGWALGFDADAEDAHEPQVWLLEGGSVVEEVGTLEQWLQERAADVRSRLEALDADALAAAAAREGDYAYGPLDLKGFDG